MCKIDKSLIQLEDEFREGITLLDTSLEKQTVGILESNLGAVLFQTCTTPLKLMITEILMVT